MGETGFRDLARRIGKALGCEPPTCALSFGWDRNERNYPRWIHWFKIGERTLNEVEIEAVERAGFVRRDPRDVPAGWEIETEEASMGAGTIRRPITRADEDEVRARLKRSGLSYEPVQEYSGDRLTDLAGYQCGQGPKAFYDALASVGIFPGRDGWEIEVRRELPSPWGWCADAMGSEFLSCKGERAIARATSTRCDVYTSRRAPVLESFAAASLTEARERAEDECWARGLLGADEDAPPVKPVATPPVDRAQAIRDALIERLTCSPLPTMDDLLNLLNGRDGRPMATVSEMIVALASIGAVCDGNRWRLSDGPPPGWEWHVGPLVASLKSIPVDGSRLIIATVRNEEDKPSARDAALMACRRAGLFAPMARADEDPAFPTDAGVGRDPTVTTDVPQGQGMGAQARTVEGLVYAPSPDPAAHALRALVARITGLDFEGTIAPTPGETATQRGAQLGRLADAFVTEMRASAKPRSYMTPEEAAALSGVTAQLAPNVVLASQLASAEKHARDLNAEAIKAIAERNTYRTEAGKLRDQLGVMAVDREAGWSAARARARERDEARRARDEFERQFNAVNATAGELEEQLATAQKNTTAGALAAYLTEHHREEWRPGEDALALAIRVIKERTGERDAFAAEARALANTAATLRQEGNEARGRLAQASADRLGAEGERDDARADLATLRADVAALAAKMGAPHG